MLLMVLIMILLLMLMMILILAGDSHVDDHDVVAYDIDANVLT